MALPPVEEQQEICQYLEPLLQKIEDQREKINTVLDRLKEYRSTLITNAVTGKIDVRNFEMPQPTEGLAL
jgi:type I restriction enzyme S subunit